MNAPPAEQRLILSCVRRAVLPDGPPSLEADERSAALWRRAVPLAGRASLSSITFTGAGGWLREAPPEAAESLRLHHLASELRHAGTIAPTLRPALEALAAADLEPIVLKGAALAYTAYAEPAHRTLSDVDLL